MNKNNDSIINGSEKIEKFFNTWKKNHNGDMAGIKGHNIYLIQTEDHEGNIIDEKYGINITTDRYFQGYFCPNQQGSPSVGTVINYLFIGDGTHDDYGDIQPNVYTLNHMTYTNSMTKISNDITRIEGSTFYWDNDLGLLRSTGFIISGYFDYALTGIDTALTITEIGLATSSSYNELVTHAYVYDAEGHYSSITKNVNEKLTISAYVITYHKPGYVENKLWNLGIGFGWNPWGVRAFGYTGRYWNWSDYYNGTINLCTHTFISSPRCGSKADDYSSNSTYRSSHICDSKKNIWQNASYDSSTKIAETSFSFNDASTLIENPEYYYDQLILNMYNGMNDSWFTGAYTSQCTIVKDIFLDTPEEISTDVAYCLSVSNGDLTGNFGHPQNSKFDVRGLLPVTNMNITDVKSYNGLTNDWDIQESVINATNTYNLTRMQLYPWVGLYMFCPYYESNILKEGRKFVRIYFNMYTDYPITSMDTDYIDETNIWCTDTYWDPSSWVHIDDPSNISSSLGIKKYFISFGGEITGNNGPSTSTRCVNVRRSGYTIPVLQTDETVELTGIDNCTNGAYGYVVDPESLTRYASTACYNIPNDTKGYIIMTNCVYYPELQTSLPITTTATASYTPSGDMYDPLQTLHFDEPSGQRMLQIFRASNHNDWSSPNLQYVSVFDIPSKTELESDPTLTLTEHIVELGSSFSNSLKPSSGKRYRVMSTETGYVIFSNPETNRTHIVNMLGDENDPSHEPYSFVLKYPGTNNEIQSSYFFPIKYTNMVVGIDPDYETDTEFGYIIIDLENNTIVDQFRIEKSLLYETQFITAVNDKIYIVGNINSDWTSTWRCFLYDLNRVSGSRLCMTDMSNELSRSLVPGGDTTDMNRYCWIQLMNSRIFGDNECILTSCYMESNSMGFYYIDLTRPTELINISTASNIPKTWFSSSYNRPTMRIFKFNNDKQRILTIDNNTVSYYSEPKTLYEYYSLFFDANLIRDTRSGPTQLNITNDAIPMRAPFSTSKYISYAPYRVSYMYKGKVWISEYSPNYTDTSRQYRQVTDNVHRIVDPRLLLQHKMTGTTTTIQAYNNPKRIYGISGVTLKLINSATIWDPSDTV